MNRPQPQKVKAAKSRPETGASVPVVGIGASAGGLEAFRRFFDAMAADSGAAFVLIQHLDPTHKSLTADLLAKNTTMPVVEVQDGVRIEANHVYTIPANADLAFADGVLHLAEPGQRRGARTPIDFFFSSLADQLQEKAIGIVLSGAGSDGALGLKAIEGNDGMTMAQTPETAQYDSMPKSAIATGAVDYVLPVEELPGMLIRYLCHSYIDGDAGQAAAGNSFESILALLHARTGYKLDHYKKNTLLRRIARRMSLVHAEDHDQYLKQLREDPGEIDTLIKDLFISVTSFFRDPPAWEALEQEIIKPLIARQDQRATIRVWVPACASGEEAYSIAMLLLEQLELAHKDCKLLVFASDINQTAVDFARNGIYPDSIAGDVGKERLRRFFIALDDGHHYQVSRRLRESVVFASQNLLVDPPFSRLDLILCRNLLIYLEPETQQKLIPLFHFALNVHGTLFLGSAETIGNQADLFETIDNKWRLFRRTGSIHHERLYHPEPASDRAPVTAEPAAAEHIPRSVGVAQRQLLERFVPATVLIDQHYNLLYFWGATEDYLVQPAGAPTRKLLDHLRQGLRNKVKAAIQQGLRDNQTAVAAIRFRRGKVIARVSVTVSIVRNTGQADKLLLVSFEDQPESVAVTPPEYDADESLVQQMETEIRIAQDDLQAHIEQSESAREEFMTANEEVTSINEELQATNEELEASKEELQSVNEELVTVNSQLQDKLEELEKVNTDLNNLLNSTDMATIFLDREFRITRFTPAATQLLPLVSTDMGRDIGIFAQKFDPALLRDAKHVLKKIVSLEAEIQSDAGHWYKRRLLPYRMADHRIGGVVITYSNITALKQEQQRATEAVEKLKTLNAELDRRVIERTAVVEEQTTKLRALAAELSFAEERERQKLATDLHEGLSQDLTLANLKLSSLEEPLKHHHQARQELQNITEILRHASETVRSHIFDLSPPVLEDFGLVKALNWLARDLKNTHNLAVDIQHHGEPGLPDERSRSILFRAVRELLINVVKHAGVDHATVTLENTASNISLTVTDNGNGFDADKISRDRKSGFGLLSILERLAYIGGEARIESAPGKGTKIVLRAPVNHE